MTPKDTIRAFCCAWFERRNLEATLAFLKENVRFVGTGEDEYAANKSEMTAYLKRDISEITEPFESELRFMNNQQLADGLHSIVAEMRLKNSQYQWNLRAFFILSRVEGRWLIQNFHFSEPSRNQVGGEHYPQTLVLENIARQRQELLDISVPGGMIGGYVEPDFPFYYVNKRMLDTLGYSSEEAFVGDIQGLISNCIHPADRGRIRDKVKQQVGEKNEYSVEYRMRKRDGSYIWVHDISRVITTEDGRPAVIAVCVDITPQRKLSEQLLHIYNNIPGAVVQCWMDEGYTLIDANEGLFDIIGYKRDEFARMGNRLRNVLDPDEKDDDVRAQLRRSGKAQGERRLLCAGGEERWVSYKAQLFRESAGDQLFLVCLDITDERRAKKRNTELYDKELSYFLKMTSQDGPVQGRANLSRNRVEKYLSVEHSTEHPDMSYDELIENFAASAVNPECSQKLREIFSRENVIKDYFLGKSDYHYEFLRRRNGQLFWSSTNLRSYLKPETDEVVAFFYTTDATERKLQEQLLQHIARFDYDLLLSLEPGRNYYSVVSLDDNVNALAYSGNFDEQYHYFAEKYLDGDARREFLLKLSAAYIEKQLSQEDFYSFVIETRDKNGQKRVKRYQVFYVSRELGRVCIARSDVTDVVTREQEQKAQLAAALQAAEQANAAKSDFLSRMSHEIRTPMNAIIGLTAIAEAHVDDPGYVADCLKKITVSSKHLLGLINEVLDMSKIESGKVELQMEDFNLPELVGNLLTMCRPQIEEKGHELSVSVSGIEHEGVVGDAQRIQQAFMNLMSNAVKYTPHGGKIKLAVREKPTNRSRVGCYEFVIEDNGIGMSGETLARLYEPFERAKDSRVEEIQGTGLGMAITKNIVQMMNGNIKVESELNKGTRFTVTIFLKLQEAGGTVSQADPAGPSAPAGDDGQSSHGLPGQPADGKKQSALEEIAAQDFSGKRALLVEDNEINAEIAGEILGMTGLAIERAKNGKEAVDAMAAAEDGFYDVIFMDVQMPVMNGYEATKAIRSLPGAYAREVPIIAMSANAFAEDVNAAITVGMNEHVAKPLDFGQLQRVLKKWLS